MEAAHREPDPAIAVWGPVLILLKVVKKVGKKLAGNANCIHTVKMARIRLTDEARSAIIRSLAASVPMTKIASDLGVSVSSVRYVKQASAPSKKANTSGGLVVSGRLTEEEGRAFDAFVGAKGFKSRSDAMRSLIRFAAGFVEMTTADDSALDDVRRELAKIGTNINQIALAANRGRTDLIAAQWASIRDLQSVLPKLRWEVQQVVAEQRRRGQLYSSSVAGVKRDD